MDKKGYLEIAVLVLLLMVLDQGCAMRKMSDYMKVQNEIITDYWNMLQTCNKEKTNGTTEEKH